MGQACSVTKNTFAEGAEQVQTELVVSALEQVLISAEESGELLLTKAQLPSGFALDDLAALNKNLLRLKTTKVLCIGDVAGQHELMDALLKARGAGKIPMLQQVYLVGRKVDDRATECAANLCGTRSANTLVVAHPRKNRVGNASAVAIANQLTVGYLKTIVLFGSRLGDSGCTSLAMKIHPRTTLRRLVLYGKNIGNTTIAAFAVALHGTPLEEIVFGGTDFSDGMELRSLLDAIWETKKCTRLGILNINLGDSVADTIVNHIRSTGYCPQDLVLLVGLATAHTFTVLSTWWGDPIRRLTICSFVANHSALASFLIKKSGADHCALELVCGRATPNQIDKAKSRFEQMGYPIVPWESPSVTDSVDVVAAAPGVVISNAPSHFLESHIFARLLLRGRRDRVQSDELSGTTAPSPRPSSI